MKRGFFITGTDTGVGKTFVSCTLLHAYTQQGLRAVGMKPVAAGCRIVGTGLLSEDAEHLLLAGNVAATPQEITTYAFGPALAPHLAARQAGVELEFAPILSMFNSLQSRADMVVVEGVGGFRVPLNARQDSADLAVELALPVILVVGMRLGCLNHALLTSEAIAARGLHLAGWVANCIDPAMEAVEDNIAALETRLGAPRIGTLPFTQEGDYQAAVTMMNQDFLLQIPDVSSNTADFR